MSISAGPSPDHPGMYEVRVVSPNHGITWYCHDDESHAPNGLVEIPSDMFQRVEAVGMTSGKNKNLLGRIVFDPIVTGHWS